MPTKPATTSPAPSSVATPVSPPRTATASEAGEQRYKTTREECARRVGDLVCPRCGEIPLPAETEDNSGDPTFWPVCCGHITWGVRAETQRIAAALAADGYVHYRHMDPPEHPDHPAAEPYRSYWLREQTAGACSLVADVLAAAAAGEWREWRAAVYRDGKLSSSVKESEALSRRLVGRLLRSGHDARLESRAVGPWEEES